MKIYELSTKNCNEIVEKLQKISNNWKLLRKQECYKESKRTKKENYPDIKKIFEHKDWGVGLVNNDNLGDFKHIYSFPTFIYIQKYDLESFETSKWLGNKPLVNMILSQYEVLYLFQGDKIIFKKYGFIIITDDKFNNSGITSLIYKNYFIIDRNNKIFNLDEEIQNKKTEHDKYLYEESLFEDFLNK